MEKNQAFAYVKINRIQGKKMANIQATGGESFYHFTPFESGTS